MAYNFNRADYCTEAGAAALAASLRAYWGSRGVEIETWIEKITPTYGSDGLSMYCVRSNLAKMLAKQKKGISGVRVGN